jgi:serine-type D-Ala-D-Ala carboxypeptidase
VTAQLRAELLWEARPGSRLARSPATEELRGYLASSLSDGFPPSVSLAVVERSGVALQAFGGWACTVGEPLATTADTSYDLASLTKVVCTVTLALIARERGALDLDDPVARWLPDYPQERTSLWHLLTHTAGLAAHRPFYSTLHGRRPIEAAVYEEAKAATPGQAVVYSDLGYMLMGWALEACFGLSLDQAFAALVARPLGLTQAQFRPVLGRPVVGRPALGRPALDGPALDGPALDGAVADGAVRDPASGDPAGHALRRIAATELDGDQRTAPGLIWGEVHDGNAYALGGVAGHAGLFTPLAELACFVQRVLVPGGVLSAESIAIMSSRQAGEGEDVRGIGWRLGPAGWGDWPESTIWHTGFTGTSLLVAPELGAAVVLLTNSVHPHRRLEDQGAFRAMAHSLLAEALQ